MENEQHIITFDSGRLAINGLSLRAPLDVFLESLIGQGFSVDEKDNPFTCFGNIVGLGPCTLKVFRKGNTVGTVIVITDRKYNEEEMMRVFERMKKDLPGDPLYDDGGYGVWPTRRVINHFWDLDQGHVTFQWDGYARVGDNDPSQPEREALDHIALWLRPPIVKDEAYWRSEVD